MTRMGKGIYPRDQRHPRSEVCLACEHLSLESGIPPTPIVFQCKEDKGGFGGRSRLIRFYAADAPHAMPKPAYFTISEGRARESLTSGNGEDQGLV